MIVNNFVRFRPKGHVSEVVIFFIAIISSWIAIGIIASLVGRLKIEIGKHWEVVKRLSIAVAVGDMILLKMTMLRDRILCIACVRWSVFYCTGFMQTEAMMVHFCHFMLRDITLTQNAKLSI